MVDSIKKENYNRYDWFIYNNDKFVGYLSLCDVTKPMIGNLAPGIVIGLYIATNYRNKGYCKDLLAELLPKFKQQFDKPFVFAIKPGNIAARHLANINGARCVTEVYLNQVSWLPSNRYMIYTL
jgi:predicted acetyltransferase